jgi:hypothetical protein
MYLQGTKDVGLFYPKNQDMTLTSYSDAGYLSDPIMPGHKLDLYFYTVE